MDINDAPKARLADHLRELDPLTATLHREAAPLLGHAMLDLLEEAGLGPGNIEAVGGEGPLALAIATAILHAAAARGQYLDAFLIDDAVARPAIDGPVVVVGFDSARVPGELAAGGPDEGPKVAGVAVVVGAAGAEDVGAAGAEGVGAAGGDGVVELALFEASDLGEAK